MPNFRPLSGHSFRHVPLFLLYKLLILQESFVYYSEPLVQPKPSRKGGQSRTAGGRRGAGLILDRPPRSGTLGKAPQNATSVCTRLHSNPESPAADDLPRDAVTSHKARNGAAQFLIDDRAPGHQGELSRVAFDEGTRFTKSAVNRPTNCAIGFYPRRVRIPGLPPNSAVPAFVPTRSLPICMDNGERSRTNNRPKLLHVQ